MEVPQGQHVDRILDDTVVLQFQLPTGWTAKASPELDSELIVLTQEQRFLQV